MISRRGVGSGSKTRKQEFSEMDVDIFFILISKCDPDPSISV